MTEKYEPMWKSLGMDLEKHGQLLNGLGQYYGTAIMSQKTDQKKWITSISSFLKFMA